MKPRPDDPKPLPATSALAELAPVHLSPTQVSLLARYIDLFAAWNKQFGFSRYSRPDSIAANLIYPSLSLIPLLPPTGSVLDLGSGPGIPGVPLSIACPDLSVTCVDSREPSVEFVKACRSALSLRNLDTILGRAEILALDPNLRDRFDLVLSRALAPLPTVVEIASAFLKPDGLILVHAVKTVSSSLDRMNSRILAVGTLFDRCGSILTPLFPDRPVHFGLFRKIAETGPQYPRSWNKMKTHPLWKTGA
jgi:16S rRNA (guanine527-N7)-methyltransferase